MHRGYIYYLILLYYENISRDLERLEARDKPKPLTTKQEEVIRLLQEGLTIPQISKRIGIVERVVYDHIKLIRKKGIEIIPVKDYTRVIRYDIKGFDTN